MPKNKKTKITGALLGTIVEYYDYSLYAFAAGIIGDKFFAESDPISKLTNVFAIYACAYFAKPLGALVFGRLGDYLGRKIALSITTIGIAIPTMIIGLLPEYASIGVLSTIVLTICRFIQGIFIGGEYDGAAIYVIEHLGAKYKYTASSAVRTTGAIGLLIGVGCINFFTSSVFAPWSWRVPFLLSMPLALLTVYYRQALDETPDFKASIQNNVECSALTDVLKKQWDKIIVVVLLAGGFGVTYQISTIFMKQYLPIIIPSAKLVISTFSILLLLCFTISMFISGLLADKFGKMIVIKTCTFFVLFGSGLLYLAAEYQLINLGLISCMVITISIAPYNALAHSSIIETFHTKERYRAISIGHTIGSMLMSGSANYVCCKFISYNFKLFPIVYLAFFSILSYFMFKLLENEYFSKYKIHAGKRLSAQI